MTVAGTDCGRSEARVNAGERCPDDVQWRFDYKLVVLLNINFAMLHPPPLDVAHPPDLPHLLGFESHTRSFLITSGAFAPSRRLPPPPSSNTASAKWSAPSTSIVHANMRWSDDSFIERNRGAGRVPSVPAGSGAASSMPPARLESAATPKSP